MASGRADWSFQQALSSPAGEALWQKRVLDCERDYLRFKTRWVTDWDIPKFLMPKSNLDKLYNQLKSIIQTATPHLIVDRDDPREGMYAINDKDKEALNLITVKSFSFSAQQLLEGTELKKFLKDKIHASYGVIPNQRDTEVLLTGYAKSIIQKLMEEFEKELIAQYGNRYPTKYTAFHEYYNNKQFANEIMGRFIPKTLSQYVIKITEELTTTLVESKHIQLSPIEGEIYKRLSAAPDMKDVNTISPAEVLRSILDTCKSSKIGATPFVGIVQRYADLASRNEASFRQINPDLRSIEGESDSPASQFESDSPQISPEPVLARAANDSVLTPSPDSFFAEKPPTVDKSPAAPGAEVAPRSRSSSGPGHRVRKSS